jgi:hypothetical protein
MTKAGCISNCRIHFTIVLAGETLGKAIRRGWCLTGQRQFEMHPQNRYIFE